jgi:hypothetical protein
MIVNLYRYPHPIIPNKYLYVGQGGNRDREHRAGKSSFGRRFKLLFPNINLPDPIKWQEEVGGQLDANIAEIIAMFVYHTWHGYTEGMNLTMPGLIDYINMGTLASHEDKVRAGKIGGKIGGKIQGAINLNNGHWQRISKLGALAQPRSEKVRAGKIGWAHMPDEAKHRGAVLGGKSQGKRNIDNGFLLSICASGGRKGSCKRWYINLNKPCICGQHI